MFYIFADDIDIVKNEFDFPYPVIYVTPEDSSSGMRLMYNCKHYVIANSTFSWWGAWLNNNENKIVICPKRFYKLNDKWHDSTDLCPKEWISIDN